MREHSDIHQQVKKALRLRFRNKKLLESALLHPSYRNEHPCPGLLDFDRLEFFGDAILNFVVCRKLYPKFPEANEGTLSRLRSILVSRRILFRVARELGFHRIVKLGKSLRKLPMFLKSKMMADSLEALLAAIYFDKSFEQTEKFILRHFKSYFDAKRLFRLDPNPKSTLQELCQKQWQKLPVYSREASADGIKTVVTLGPSLKASAVARNRQESEEKAARLLIRKIRQELLGRSKRISSGRKLRRTF